MAPFEISLSANLSLGGFVVCANGVPVNHAPKRLEIIRAAVLVLEIIGMLPNIAAKNRRSAFHQRCVLISRVTNTESAVGLDAQPRPTAAKLCGARGFEFFLE